jgi:hypothetical protein
MARKSTPRTLTDEAIAKALMASGGVYKDAAAILNCSRGTIWSRVCKSPDLFRVAIEADTATGAKAVENIKTAIARGDVRTSQWWCNCRIHDHFSQRQEVTGSNGGPIKTQDVTDSMTEEQIDAALARLCPADSTPAQGG